MTAVDDVDPALEHAIEDVYLARDAAAEGDFGTATFALANAAGTLEAIAEIFAELGRKEAE